MYFLPLRDGNVVLLLFIDIMRMRFEYFKNPHLHGPTAGIILNYIYDGHNYFCYFNPASCNLCNSPRFGKINLITLIFIDLFMNRSILGKSICKKGAWVWQNKIQNKNYKFLSSCIITRLTTYIHIYIHLF